MQKYFWIYLAIISTIAVIATLYDKMASVHFTNNRISENHLLLISILGGSLSMMLLMLLIRHKTKHPKFMIGIPLIILLQVALIAFLIGKGIIVINIM